MLSRTAAVLVMIDFQGNLARTMVNKRKSFANNVKLIRGFQALGCDDDHGNKPLINLVRPSGRFSGRNWVVLKPIAKETFSCLVNLPFVTARIPDRRHVVLTGIECHICVYQTSWI